MSEYPATKRYETTVARVAELSPHLTRITVRGDELQHFGTVGLDQRIKLLLPHPGGQLPAPEFFDAPLGEWYAKWRLLPAEERGTMRTYTARAIRPGARELDIDFVLHGTEGPASAWAASAAVGDSLVVLGPDARSAVVRGGVEWQPGSARRVLIAGDETALPAIASILESLDESYQGAAFIEVPERADAIELRCRADVAVHVLPREDAEHGSVLDAAVRQWLGGSGADSGVATAREFAELDPDVLLWEVPEDAAGFDAGIGGGFYAWLAGEAGVITGLRRHLVRDLGIDRHSIAFMGYWRRGRAEAN